MFRFFAKNSEVGGENWIVRELERERERERGLGSERIGEREREDWAVRELERERARGLDSKRIGQRELRAEGRWGWWV